MLVASSPNKSRYDSTNDESLHQFIKALPKLELHAHLNGSIREHTLIELATERNVQLPQSLIQHDAVEQQQQKEDDGRSIPLFLNTRPRSLQDCFEVFEYIPQCVNDLVALRRITEEVLYDAAADGIAYIELRTGPKCLLHRYSCDGGDKQDGGAGGVESSSMATKREYVQTIIDIMQEFEEKESLRYTEEMKSNHNHRCDDNKKIVRLPLIPRLIISVDRSGTLAQADENINLAIELFQQQQQQHSSSRKGDASQNKYIVGVELGGNPTKNDFTNFEASFERARKAGLRVAIHIGEVPMASSKHHPDESHSSTSPSAAAAAAIDSTLLAKYKEALAVINFRPDRLGHALTLSSSLIELLYNDPIPIECCPTSNTMTLDYALHHEGSLIDGMKMHPHLKKWIDTGYPISINTDDSGIFCTNLTKEFLLIAKVFGLDEKRLSKIVLDSVEHVFDEDIKDRLRSDIQSVVDEMICE
jgi:adenosine deaminase